MTINKTIKLLLTFLCFAASSYSFGYQGREYEVLDQFSIITIGNKSLKINEFVIDYQPQVFYKLNKKQDSLLKTFYEVIEKDEVYRIIYYHCWQNEYNPSKILNIIYNVFRSAYYGKPLYDIEYFQIDVSKKDGKPIKFRMESSMKNKFDQKFVKHYTSELKEVENEYVLSITDSRNKFYKESKTTPILKDYSIFVGVQTWNHMLVFLSNNNKNKFERYPLNSKLIYLSKDLYKKHKFSRKSKGEVEISSD